MIIVGLDPGYGTIKVTAIGKDGTLRTAYIPAVVGVGTTDLGLLSLGTLKHRRRRAKPDRVTFDGVFYLVGENLSRYAQPVERLDFQRLSGGMELQAAIYAALARVFAPSQHDVLIMLGLPVEVIADRAQAMEVVRAIRAWLVGEHIFQVNEETYRLTVHDVRAMPQPAGTFFAWGMDNHGHWVRAHEDLKAAVGICDIGFNTIDLFAVEGGDVVARFTVGKTAGMHRAAEFLARALFQQYGLELSLHEADALLRQSSPKVYVTGKGAVSVASMARQALEATAGHVVGLLRERWGRGVQFAHILFTGGGAAALQDALIREYPYGEILPNPVMANAIGLARYAVRVFRKKRS